jgi:hypothetical protein
MDTREAADAGNQAAAGAADVARDARMRVSRSRAALRAAVCAAGLATGLLVAPAGRAMTVPAWTAAELAARSDVIVEGVVTGARVRAVGRRVVTFYVVVAGEGAALRSYLVAVPGGSIDGITQRVPGAPVLNVGRRYRLHLGKAEGPRDAPDGPAARGVVGFFRGVELVDEGPGRAPVRVPFTEAGVPAGAAP